MTGVTIAELQQGPMCSALSPVDIEILAANDLDTMVSTEVHEHAIESMQEQIDELTGAAEEQTDERAGDQVIIRVLRRVHKAARRLQLAKAADDCVDPALWTALDDAITAARFAKETGE